MDCQNIIFSRHAIQQMFLRRITKRDVQAVVAYGEVIEENPDDIPFPSYLFLDFVEGRPIHVVFSYDESTDTGYVVTAYLPEPKLWTNDFRTRR